MSTSAGRLERWLPIVATVRSYQWSWLGGDLAAGVVLTALLIPAGMGYAEVAGLPPVTGLYATMIPLLAYAVFGPSRVLVLGPDSSLAPIIAATIVPLAAVPADRVGLAGLLAIEVGIVLVLASVLNLGRFTSLLARPIRVGYLNGIALIVVLGQLPALLGFRREGGDSLLRVILGDIRAVLEVRMDRASALIGLTCLAVIIGLRKWRPAIPGVLVALAGAIAFMAITGWSSRVPVVGAMPSGLPRPQLGSVTWDDAVSLIGPAVGIALIAFADTGVLSRTFAARGGTSVDGNQEMAALGASNVASGLFGGFAVSASASRTPVAEQAGGRTQLTGIVGAVMILLFILVAPGVTAYLPSSALAAVVIVAATALVDVRSMIELMRVDRVEGVLAIAALLGVAFVGVLEGILVAIALAGVAFIRSASRPYRAELGKSPGTRGYHDVTRYADAQRMPGLLILRFDAPLFFANSELFDDFVRDRVARALDDGHEVRTVVLAAEPISSIDSTAIEKLVDVDDYLHAHGIELIFAEMKDPVRDQLARYRLTIDGEPRFGPSHFSPTVGAIVDELTKDD